MAYRERNPPFQALPHNKSATIFVIILQKYARKQAKQSKKMSRMHLSFHHERGVLTIFTLEEETFPTLFAHINPRIVVPHPTYPEEDTRAQHPAYP